MYAQQVKDFLLTYPYATRLTDPEEEEQVFNINVDLDNNQILPC